MRVIINNEGAVTVIKPLGSLLSGELKELDQALLEMAKNWTKRIVINLTDSTCIDSAGLELINRHHRQLTDRGLRLKLCGLNELCSKILELTRLSRQFEIFNDTSAAIRSFL